MTFFDWMTANEEVLGEGPGLFCALHIGLMISLFSLLVVFYFVFKKHPIFAKKYIFVICIFMIISRVFRMIFRIAVGEDSFFEAMPWHLCHIMCFVIGFMTLFNVKKFITPIAVFAFFGGILTFLFGDYYQYNILTFYDIESIILHFMLPLVSIYYLATKQLKLSYSTILQTAIFILCLVSYAEIGNTIFGDTNFMYIRENGLPFKIFPGSHIFTYLFLVVLTFAVAIVTLAVKDYFKNHRHSKQQKRIMPNSIIDDEEIISENE